MWACAPRASSTRTMSISSSKFNLHRKHGNTALPAWFTCVVSLCYQWVYSRESGMRNGIQVHYISKIKSAPNYPQHIYWFKKKKAKRQWDILLRKSFLLRLHTVNGWSPWPGFYHTLKSQSRQLGPLKKENNPLRIFLYENKNLSHSAISSKASYFTESSDFDPCIKFPVEAQSIFLCWINPHKYSLELKSKVSNGFL